MFIKKILKSYRAYNFIKNYKIINEFAPNKNPVVL